ncbi:hypothetical protein ACT4MK_18750 [Bradyrhizobium barranii]|uniref:hypothetical protein n=1 Tax=Bradyrhizobium barranii TaxID=2992140 RepID=UPI004034504D
MASIDIDMLRAATERIYEHRKILRSVGVGLRFGPQGLRIAVTGVTPDLVTWTELETISQAELLARIDQVCDVNALQAELVGMIEEARVEELDRLGPSPEAR